VVELAARMPSRFKLRDGMSKYVFKEALRPILPPGVFTRKKSGFSIPIAHGLRGGMKDFARSHLFDSGGAASLGLFETAGLKRLWDEHQSGMRDHAFPLFALLSFSLWHARFMGAGPVPPALAATPATPSIPVSSQGNP
jgi:asparagine synthase (glutamine-hydrolysing)